MYRIRNKNGDFNMELRVKNFENAAARISDLVHKTELTRSETFSLMAKGDVYLKCENRQKTGSFKIRGAANKIASLSQRGELSSVIASSAGNHAQGVACAASALNIPSTIVMPKIAPIAKIQATEGYGAKVVLHGDVYDDAYLKAKELCETEKSTFIHPFNDFEVMAGQGTVGLEILGELPTVDQVLIPVGGGGLLAGVAACIKQINPRVRIIGVQASGADAMVRSFNSSSYMQTETASTIADGIAVKSPGDLAFDIVKNYVDDMICVSDSEIASAILLLLERSKLVVEPAGAASLAAALSDRVNTENKRTVCLLSGGNIDVSFIPKIIEQGLVSRHRRLKFRARLKDAPGTLVALLNEIAKSSGNVISINHDRMSAHLLPNEIHVDIACEVAGKKHADELIRTLENNGYVIDSIDNN